VTIPLARTARAIDLAVGERTGGPVFLAADGRRLGRHGAGRIVRKTTRRAGIGKAVTPIRSGTRSSRLRWMPGSRAPVSSDPLSTRRSRTAIPGQTRTADRCGRWLFCADELRRADRVVLACREEAGGGRWLLVSAPAMW